MNKKTKIFFAILLIVIIGFLREHIFVTVNIVIAQVYHHNFEYDHLLPIWANKLLKLSYIQLLSLKWLFTLMFVVIYWFVAVFLFKLFSFQKKQIQQYTVIISITLGISLLFFFIGDMLFHKEYIGYKVARILVGFLQSPLPMCIYFPLNYSLLKINKQS